MKRVLALILSLCMILSALPIVGAAQEDAACAITTVTADRTQTEVTLLAREACTLYLAAYDMEGRMVGVSARPVSAGAGEQTVSIPMPKNMPEYYDIKVFLLDSETNQPLCESAVAENAGHAGYGYAVAGLELTGGELSAVVSTAGACELLVQVLSEDGQTELFRGTAPAGERLELEELRVNCGVSLPEHYLLRAVLRAGGEELCKPFFNRDRTAAHMAFDALTEEDFPEQTVLDYAGEDDGNFAVLVDGVARLDQSAGVNRLTSREDGVCTFVNADAALSGLKAGDRFCFENAAGEYICVKVKATTVNPDGSVTVTEDRDVYISDFYRVIKLDAELQNEAPAAYGLSDRAAYAAGIKGTVTNITMGPAVKTNIELPFGSLEGSARVGAKLEVNYNPELLGEDYLEFTCLARSKVEAELTLGAKNHTKDTIPFVSIPLTGIKGVAEIPFEVALVYETDLEAGVTVGFVAEETMGCVYSSVDGLQKVQKKNIYQDQLSMDTKVKAEAKASIGIQGGLKARLLDDMMVLGLGAEAGVAFEAEAEVFGGTLSKGLEQFHACDLCLSGEIKGYFEVEFTADYEITRKLKGSLLDLDFVRADWKVGMCYASLINHKDSIFKGVPSFGLEDECPNKKYKASIAVFDSQNQAVTGCEVTVSKPGGAVVDSGASPYELYLYPGVYTAKAVIDGRTDEEQFIVEDKPVSIILKGEDHVVSGVVTDELGTKLSGVSVEALCAGEAVASDTSDSAGRYSLKLPDGTYQLTFTAEGYESGSGEVTVPGDEKLNMKLTGIPYTVTFLPGEGSGTMAPMQARAGQPFVLPECTFTAPEELVFGGWQIGEEIYKAGESYEGVSGDFSMTATWKEEVYPVHIKVLYDDGTPFKYAKIEGTGLDKVPVANLNGEVSVELPAGFYTLSICTDELFANQAIMVDREQSVTMTVQERVLEWSVDESTQVLTVSGKGPMPDYGYAGSGKEPPWIKDGTLYEVKEIRVVGLSSVGKLAFFGGRTGWLRAESLETVLLDESVTSIGYRAFGSQYGLSRVVIPDGVTEIGAWAFSDCAVLKEAKLPSQLRELGESAFYNTALEEVHIPEGVSEIPDKTFGLNLNLKIISIPTSVKAIHECAFGSPVLEVVHYAGTQEQWNAIEVKRFSGSNMEELNLNPFVKFNSFPEI